MQECTAHSKHAKTKLQVTQTHVQELTTACFKQKHTQIHCILFQVTLC